MISNLDDVALYRTDSFKIYQDKVVQDKYSATALSDTEITSTYQAAFKSSSEQEVIFKFAINGEDNESGYVDHHSLILAPHARSNRAITPLYAFGQKGPDPKLFTVNADSLEPGTELILRVDLRPIFEAFDMQGYVTLYNGSKIKKEDFKGVWVSGQPEPLSWDYSTLASNKKLQLQETEETGIFEIKLHFNVYSEEKPTNEQKPPETWKLETDITPFPQYSSSFRLAKALYNMSLEELLKCIRKDGAFMAGAEWEGVWTRDISYSIVLSLAFVSPEVSKESLMRKVSPDGLIIQDTGTGGSYPCSSDRITWAAAADELYRVTGDKEWLKKAYKIVKQSVEADLATVYDKETGLFRGESSFLDWREQTYPIWAQPVDIYKSICLGTNIMHYKTYKALVEMGKELKEDVSYFESIAAGIKGGINKYLWLEDKGYYAQFFYGRNFYVASRRAEALGESLAIIYDVTDEKKQNQILTKTPVTTFGVPVVYPQQPQQPPYHNDGIWPFVQAFWTWAGAKAKNTAVVEHGIACMFRQAALFLTNKENLVATTGDFFGTCINSDRQIWSVAGTLAMIYRVLFGMDFRADRLIFRPFVPKAWGGEHKLFKVKYRNCVLNITLRGYGCNISKFFVDDKQQTSSELFGTIEGEHEIILELDNKDLPQAQMNMIKNHYTLLTPEVAEENGVLRWRPIDRAKVYIVLKNGEIITETSENTYKLAPSKTTDEYSVKAVDEKGWESYISEPLTIYPETHRILKEVKSNASKELRIKVDISEGGEYWIDFIYMNMNGPINTDNKCAIRTLIVGEKVIGKIVLPQRGSLDGKGYTNSLFVRLEKGENIISLALTETDRNMNGSVNEAYIDTIRLLRK